MDAGVFKAEHVAEQLASALAAGECAAKLVEQDEGLGYGVIVTHLKDRVPAPELHREADDVYYVLEGEGTVYLGGEIEDAEENAPGEIVGKRLIGASATTVTPGDIVSIPRCTPHMMGCPGGEVKYLVMKVY